MCFRCFAAGLHYVPIHSNLVKSSDYVCGSCDTLLSTSHNNKGGWIATMPTNIVRVLSLTNTDYVCVSECSGKLKSA